THTHKHLLCERIYPTDSFLPFCCGVTIRSLFHASTVHTLAPPVSPTLAPLTHTHTHTHTSTHTHTHTHTHHTHTHTHALTHLISFFVLIIDGGRFVMCECMCVCVCVCEQQGDDGLLIN